MTCYVFVRIFVAAKKQIVLFDTVSEAITLHDRD